jgi:NOL1/NOP2/fmu family ribosome biogenesis protein
LPTLASEAERKKILDYFLNRFGIPEKTFDGFCFLMGERKIWVVRNHPELEGILNQLKVESAGIPLLRTKPSMWKPTTAGLHLFGLHATRNVIDLVGDAMQAFLKKETIDGPFPIESGFVIVRCEGKVLGCGIYGKQGLSSLIPEKRGEPFRGKFYGEDF